MAVFISFLCVLAAPALGWRLWREVEGRDDARLMLWFSLWAAKGMALPLVAWQLMDYLWVGPYRAAAMAAAAAAGLPARTAFTLQMQRALTPDWWPASTFEAVLLIAAVWATVNFLWTAGSAWSRVDDRRGMWISALITGLFLLPVGMLLAFGLGLAGYFWGAAGWFACLAQVWSGRIVGPPVNPNPSYSGAVGLLKFGRFEQAEQAIIEQLESAEDDYAGWMMLAELYALHFHDLPTADRTVRDLCAQPNVNGSQVAAALNKLADWYLAVDENPVAARSVVAEIEQRYPQTHLAHMARQRLNRLPASRAELQAAKQVPTIRLRPGAAARPSLVPLTALDPDAAGHRAEELHQKLTDNPQDIRAREELARLLEGPLKEPAAAEAQLQQLLIRRDVSAEQRSEWLNLLATWQLRHQRTTEAGRVTLGKIVSDHAGTPAADQAAKRLQVLAIEERFRPAAPPGEARPKAGPIRVEVPRPPVPPAPPPGLPPVQWE